MKSVIHCILINLLMKIQQAEACCAARQNFFFFYGVSNSKPKGFKLAYACL